ncbi:MAG: argininosuccinate lyase [Candidatus Omnitrophica bacterium]|nr:argininosuccinate lyase [Candidatus Omnitrophota bacterium]
MKYMWEGRFKEKTEEDVINFTSSLAIDKKLALYDIKGSIGHTKMLVKCRIISKKDGDKVIAGLKKIKTEILEGKFKFTQSDEDIHTAIERRLIEITGKTGERLHTARSRNDQIVLDERLYLKDVLKQILSLISNLQKKMIEKAEANFHFIMPAYTHLQQSQPVLLSHYLLSYVEMLERDKSRIQEAYKRMDILPAGVCACCGTSLPVDREYLAKVLGFSGISRNSLDTVASRDFLIESAFDCVLLMLNLSRFSEDIILWNTYEFGFVELPEKFCTGSSIMPQKKNPDVLELIRGKSASATGMIAGLMALMKGLPLSYNRDMQEDKRLAFNIFEDTLYSLDILVKITEDIRFRKDVMKEKISQFTLATDIAEYLVKKGVPFRESHRICGAIVRYCLEKNKSFSELSLKEWKDFCPKISEDIKYILSFEESVRQKKSYGGTSPEIVRKELNRWKKILK